MRDEYPADATRNEFRGTPAGLIACLPSLSILLQFRRAMRAACGFDGDNAQAVRAFLGRRFGGSGRRRGFLHLVCGFYDQEDHERNDQEVNNGLYERAPFDNRFANGEG